MKKWKNDKNSNVAILCKIFILYLSITIVFTILYEVVPLQNLFGIWGKDSFYEAIIMGMYSSLVDFLIFSIILAFLLSKWETHNRIKKNMDEIEACRFWFSEQAAYKLRSLVQLLQEENIFSLDLTKCYLCNIKLKKTKFTNSELMGAILSESNFTHSEFVECDLQGAFCEKTTFKACVFKMCTMRLLKCKESDLSSSQLQDCNLEMTDFTNADLRYSILKNCNLKKVVFSGCNLERVNLIGCKNIDVQSLIKCKSLKYAKLDSEITDLINQLNPDLLK